MLDQMIANWLATDPISQNIHSYVSASMDPTIKQRLSQCRSRYQEGAGETDENFEFDNFLRGELQTAFRLGRIKQADQFGLRYWVHGRESICNQSNLDSFITVKSSSKHYWEMMKQDADICGGLDFTGMSHGLELECLSSFLATSMKTRAVDDYLIRSSANARSQASANEIDADLHHKIYNELQMAKLSSGPNILHSIKTLAQPVEATKLLEVHSESVAETVPAGPTKKNWISKDVISTSGRNSRKPGERASDPRRTKSKANAIEVAVADHVAQQVAAKPAKKARKPKRRAKKPRPK